MSDCRYYDSNQISIIFAGILIDSGFADGEFVLVENESNDFDDVSGTDGAVTRSKTNDGRATVTIKLMQSAPVNAALSALRNVDLLAPNGAGVGPLLIKDRSGTTVFAASKAWIMKPPSASFDRTATSREWQIRCANLVRIDGGN